jgi:iron complex transport system ATP-binding protein
MVKPGILILDEPAAGLDPVAREDFLDKLGTLMTEEKNNLGGPIILYVTHHVEEIIPAFTHALLLRQGRVLSQGPISECLTAANLSKVFGRRVRITKRNGRFSLRLVRRKRSS